MTLAARKKITKHVQGKDLKVRSIAMFIKTVHPARGLDALFEAIAVASELFATDDRLGHASNGFVHLHESSDSPSSAHAKHVRIKEAAGAFFVETYLMGAEVQG